jgi:hypothetical protein
MLREFMIPLVTLCCIVIGGIGSLDKLCLFHQKYQSVSAKLESERWLLEQCLDPLFFSRMHTHSDLCFQVENNARVGAFMLTLRELTQAFLMQPSLIPPVLSSLQHSVFSWPVAGVVVALLLLGPSWLVSCCASGTRTMVLPSSHDLVQQSYPHFPGRRWPECADGHYKSA